MKRRAFLQYAFAFASAATLTACGFHLRGSNGEANLPFKTIYLGLPETSVLGTELRRYIRATGDTRIVSDPTEAEALFDILTETREKGNQLLNSQGRVREYTLYYKLRFQVKGQQGKLFLPPTEITVKRNISFNESEVLAKEAEDAQVYRDMQSDLVQQLMRRLAAIESPK